MTALAESSEKTVESGASAKRVRLGLNLPETPDNDRVKATKGMCKQAVDITDAEAVDDELAVWIRASYEAAG